jgi:hypothetical protein
MVTKRAGSGYEQPEKTKRVRTRRVRNYEPITSRFVNDPGTPLILPEDAMRMFVRMLYDAGQERRARKASDLAERAAKDAAITPLETPT